MNWEYDLLIYWHVNLKIRKENNYVQYLGQSGFKD